MPKRTAPARQRTRRTIILLSFLLFPLIYNFFSPYLIVDGAMRGIVSGSALAFVALFAGALVFGRGWCGWGCPIAGLSEAAFAANDRPARTGRLDWIKWAIWIPWLALIAFMVIRAGGYRSVQPLYSLDNVAGRLLPYIVIYYGVVGLVAVLSLTAGRRAFCHYVCWMAPFMILGRALRNLAGWPSLRLRAQSENCTACKQCSGVCPMSLDVQGMVAAGRMENRECALCGSCADTCPNKVIHLGFGSGK